MICKKCGTENPEENQFCSKCGKKLKSQNKMDYKKKKIIAIVIGIIILLFIIGIIIYQIQKNFFTNDLKEKLNQEILNITNSSFGNSNKNALTITNEYSYIKNGKHYIGGKLTNNSNNIYQYVIIKGILHGTKGEEEEALGIVTFLGANQEADFIAFQTSDISIHSIEGIEIKDIQGKILPNEKNITNDFSIYSKYIVGYDNEINIGYHLKNISNKDYNEPFTVLFTIKSKKTGETYTAYEEFSKINSNVSIEGYCKNYLLYDSIGGSYLVGEDMSKYYTYELDCVVLGSIKDIEEDIFNDLAMYSNN